MFDTYIIVQVSLKWGQKIMEVHGNYLSTNSLARIYLFWYERPKILEDDYHRFETSEKI